MLDLVGKLRLTQRFSRRSGKFWHCEQFKREKALITRFIKQIVWQLRGFKMLEFACCEIKDVRPVWLVHTTNLFGFLSVLCSCCCFLKDSQSLSATNWPCWPASCWPTATYQPPSWTASSTRTLSKRVRTKEWKWAWKLPFYSLLFFVPRYFRLCIQWEYNRNLIRHFWSGVSAAFAVKLFKSWINEKDINSVAGNLRKVGMDNRLMVNELW